MVTKDEFVSTMYGILRKFYRSDKYALNDAEGLAEEYEQGVQDGVIKSKPFDEEPEEIDLN